MIEILAGNRLFQSMHGSFLTTYPRIVPSQTLYDGAFRVNGNVILGFTNDLSLVSLGVHELRGGCCCFLNFWNVDPHQCDLKGVSASLPLFSRNGMIQMRGTGIVISATEVKSDVLKFVVTGQNPEEGEFVYFSIFFDMEGNEKSVYHFSLSTNNRKYRWNPNTSLLLNPVSVVVNCVSSVRMVTLVDGQIKFFQFDVARYLGRILQQSTKFLETYEVDIISKNEENATVVVEIGYVFYSEKRGVWYAAVDLVEVPVDGKPVKVLHQETKRYETRSGDQLVHEMAEYMAVFRSLSVQKDQRMNYMITENQPENDIEGVRLIKAPDWNLVIADEKNGRFEF